MLIRACRDQRGSVAIEVALTAPAFLMLLFGTFECGLVLWTQLAIQRGAEMGARCATINSTLCSTASAVQSYAAQQALGLNPDPATFVLTTADCGNQVTAQYTYRFTAAQMIAETFGVPAISLNAQSCFPK